MTEEVWLTIPEFPMYDISSNGRIFSRYSNRLLTIGGKLCGGYHGVTFFKDGTKQTMAVHRALMEVFYPREDMGNLHVNHKDCNKHNNQLNNLEWTTRSENTIHAFANGLHKNTIEAVKQNYGSKHPRSKLTEQQVHQIRCDLTSRHTDLAKIYGVTPTTILNIRKFKIWKRA